MEGTSMYPRVLRALVSITAPSKRAHYFVGNSELRMPDIPLNILILPMYFLLLPLCTTSNLWSHPRKVQHATGWIYAGNDVQMFPGLLEPEELLFKVYSLHKKLKLSYHDVGLGFRVNDLPKMLKFKLPDHDTEIISITYHISVLSSP